MKISNLSPVKACNTAEKMSLTWPSGPNVGELVRDEDGRTLDFYVYGYQSERVTNAKREAERRWGKFENRSEEQSEAAGSLIFAAMVDRWSDNIEDSEGPVTVGDMERLIELVNSDGNGWIATQVSNYSVSLKNYPPKNLGGSKSGSAALHGSTQSQKSKTGADGSN